MTHIKTFFSQFTFALLLLIFLYSNTFAQNDLEYNYVKTSTQSVEREGTLRYMTFHDHSVANLPYHEHYYRDPLTYTIETYSLTSLSAQWYLNSRTLAYAYIPYVSNKREIDNSLNEVVKKSGLGDIIIGGKHFLYNSALYKQNPSFKQYLVLGVGLKLPSGSYSDFDEAKREIEPTLQPGSGTMDFLITGDYQFHYNRFTLQAAANYSITQKNKYTYQYGNQINASIEALYELEFNPNIDIVPNMALQYTDAESNAINGALIDGSSTTSAFEFLGTGGQMLWGSLGLAVKMNRTQVQFDYFLLMSEDLIGSQLPHKNRWEVGVRWDFGKGNVLSTKGRRNVE
ncbi:MAG: transporter [Chitinophagales bacterium]